MTIGPKFYTRFLFVTAFAVLIATNAFVLHGVGSNRTGKAESRLILTERELQLRYHQYAENTGLSLQLSWRILPRIQGDNVAGNWGTPGWLNQEKLGELGYDVEELLRLKKNNKYYRDTLSKEVYIVLELGGEPYREALRRAKLNFDTSAERNHEAAKRKFEREHKQMSRLFAIDAGLDPSILRRRYGDRQRYLIAKGQVIPAYSNHSGMTDVAGRIRRLSIEKVHVPLNLRETLDSLPPADYLTPDKSAGPRYQVEIAYGMRYEPWITSISPLAEESTPIEENAEERGSSDDDA